MMTITTIETEIPTLTPRPGTPSLSIFTVASVVSFETGSIVVRGKVETSTYVTSRGKNTLIYEFIATTYIHDLNLYSQYLHGDVVFLK